MSAEQLEDYWFDTRLSPAAVTATAVTRSAERNYNRKNKNEVREQLIERAILECATGLRAKDVSALRVAYLPGEQDLERPLYLRAGLQSHNLLPVERHAGKVATLRANGTPACSAWIQNLLPFLSCDFIHIDISSCFSEEGRAVVDGMLASPHTLCSTLWALNMFRDDKLGEYEPDTNLALKQIDATERYFTRVLARWSYVSPAPLSGDRHPNGYFLDPVLFRVYEK